MEQFHLRKRLEGQRPARILIVEDEMLIAMCLQDFLTDLGCEVVWASRVVKGLQVIDTEIIDGAFLDVNLFGTPVYPLAHELGLRGIPFALLTGGDASRLAEFYGNCQILTKPFAVEMITQAVANFGLSADRACDTATPAR